MKHTDSSFRYLPLYALLTAMFAGSGNNNVVEIGGFKGNPEFHTRRKGFKGYMREQHLGRRRSKYYFNKNR